MRLGWTPLLYLWVLSASGFGDSTASAISTWVSSHVTATTVGSSTVHDLTGYTG